MLLNITFFFPGRSLAGGGKGAATGSWRTGGRQKRTGGQKLGNFASPSPSPCSLPLFGLVCLPFFGLVSPSPATAGCWSCPPFLALFLRPEMARIRLSCLCCPFFGGPGWPFFLLLQPPAGCYDINCSPFVGPAWLGVDAQPNQLASSKQHGKTTCMLKHVC